MDRAGTLELRGLEDMRMQSNIRVLSDGDAQALLPVLSDVGRIYDGSRTIVDVGNQRVATGKIPLIGKRRAARKTILKDGKMWRY
jgi:hypothetical protein